MGSSQSKSPEEIRRNELYELGVLIPPSFGVAGTNTPPSAILARTPSLISILQQTSLSHQLLYHHTVPGVWLMAKTNKGGSILASSSVPTDRGYQEGLLCFTQKFNDYAMLQCRAPTVGNTSFYGSVLLNPILTATSQMDVKGIGWMAINIDATDLANQCIPIKTNNVQEGNYPDTTRSVQLGTWTNVQQFKTATSISGYAAYQVPGVTLAAEATLPFSTLEPQLSCHLSCDLTDHGTSPHVVVNLSKSPQQTSLSFSQLFTFDRFHFNILDNRTKKVRNTFGWTVDMKHKQGEPVTQLSTGVAWQVNRALAFKATTHIGGRTSGAILLKRWQQPQITCALMFSATANGKVTMNGFGIELETFASNDNVYGMVEETHVRLSSNAPETKATISK